MAEIPLGNFGNTQQTVTRQTQVSLAGSAAINNATQNLANSGMQVANQMQQEQAEMARVKAANVIADHELKVKQTAADIQRKVQSGELKYQDAQKQFNESISGFQPPSIDGADDVVMENVNRGIKQINGGVDLQMQDFVYGQQQQEFKGQFVTFLDTQAKLAGMPGADIGKINETAAINAAEMAKKAGIDEGQYAKLIQDFKDNNWTNHLIEKSMMARNDLGALKTLEDQLTDPKGEYAGKLDTNKRNMILGQVMNQRTQLENKIQLQADRQDAKAERAILQIDQQISTGVPATAKQWAKWESVTKGTAQEAEFSVRIEQEQFMQEVLRKPVNEQISFVQQKEADLKKNGGSVTDIANFNRLQTAVNNNVKQLQESPLIYAQARTGATVEPLDLSGLGTDEGNQAITAQFAERASTLAALKKQYGDQVQSRPLLPQEVQQLSAALEKMAPEQQASMFSILSNAIGDGETYRGAMNQIAPDSVVKANAGRLMGYTGEQTINENTFSADEKVTAKTTAVTMLIGENILNKSKSASATDGKPVTLPIPSSEKFAQEFVAQVGSAYSGRTGAMQADMQAVRAHYVGETSIAGDFSPEIDPNRLKKSISAVIGEPVSFNGTDVLLPWGIDESTFRDQVRVNLAEEMKSRGVSSDESNQVIVSFNRLGLANFGDGEYLVLDGARRPYMVKGQPVTVKVK